MIILTNTLLIIKAHDFDEKLLALTRGGTDMKNQSTGRVSGIQKKSSTGRVGFGST